MNVNYIRWNIANRVFMKQSMLIFLGGGLGACLRFFIAQLANKICWDFPIGIFAINAIGCFLMGAIIVFFQTVSVNILWHSFVIIGFLGGFTTFSSFTYDYWHLFQRGDFLGCALYLFGTILLSFLFLILGMKIIKILLT